jgi:hypothetical protein
MTNVNIVSYRGNLYLFVYFLKWIRMVNNSD